MHRILITGSNGLLGQKLVHLLKANNQVELLATSTGENRISDQEGYEYLQMDITSKTEVDTVFEKFKPTAVINTAAMTLVDLCETEQEKCRLVNVQGVENLLNASSACAAQLIQVSTDFVFDGSAGPYREIDVPNPLSEYARSKYEAEKLLENSSYNNWSIARTIILYGICENMSRSNVVLWARETLKKGGPMKIVDDQFRSPTLAEDLANGCWEIAKRKAIGIYHLSGPEVMSVLTMVERIAAYYDYPTNQIEAIKTNTLGQAAARPPYTGFILDKAKTDLDYQPRTIEEGLAILDQY